MHHHHWRSKGKVNWAFQTVCQNLKHLLISYHQQSSIFPQKPDGITISEFVGINVLWEYRLCRETLIWQSQEKKDLLWSSVFFCFSIEKISYSFTMSQWLFRMPQQKLESLYLQWDEIQWSTMVEASRCHKILFSQQKSPVSLVIFVWVKRSVAWWAYTLSKLCRGMSRLWISHSHLVCITINNEVSTCYVALTGQTIFLRTRIESWHDHKKISTSSKFLIDSHFYSINIFHVQQELIRTQVSR